MRRFALLGLTLLLPACQTMVGNPLDGAGGFIADTHTFHLNPNRPVGEAPNVLRVEGRQVDQVPLTPEPGDVWPGPIAPEPTLQDIERQQNQSLINSQHQQVNQNIQTHAIGLTNCSISGGTVYLNRNTQQKECSH